MLREGTNLKKEKINFLFSDGGLGDNICRMTTMKYIKEQYPHVKPYLWVPDYFLELARHLVPGIQTRSFTLGKMFYDEKLPGRRTSDNHHDTMRSHLVDNAFHLLANKQVDIKHKNYIPLRLNEIDINKFHLSNKYVIITTAFTAPVREMLPEVVNKLSDYIKSKGYEVVFLGNRYSKVGALVDNIKGNLKEDIDFTKGIDLIDKTNLLEAGKIIAGAKALVGLDNGLMHLAGCTDVPIVGGYTTVEPIYRLPYRNNQLGWNCYPVVPEETLKCRFCQSNFDFIYDHDFRTCYYKDYKCTKMLTAEKYTEQLEKIL